MPVRVQAGGFTKYSRRRGNTEAKARFLIRLQGTTREISSFLKPKKPNPLSFLNSHIISSSFTKDRYTHAETSPQFLFSPFKDSQKPPPTT